MIVLLVFLGITIPGLVVILRAVRRELRQAAASLMPHPGMPDAQPWPGECGDRWEGMTCTRTRGHDGLHADDTSWSPE